MHIFTIQDIGGVCDHHTTGAMCCERKQSYCRPHLWRSDLSTHVHHWQYNYIYIYICSSYVKCLTSRHEGNTTLVWMLYAYINIIHTVGGKMGSGIRYMSINSLGWRATADAIICVEQSILTLQRLGHAHLLQHTHPTWPEENHLARVCASDSCSRTYPTVSVKTVVCMGKESERPRFTRTGSSYTSAAACFGRRLITCVRCGCRSGPSAPGASPCSEPSYCRAGWTSARTPDTRGSGADVCLRGATGSRRSCDSWRSCTASGRCRSAVWTATSSRCCGRAASCLIHRRKCHRCRHRRCCHHRHHRYYHGVDRPLHHLQPLWCRMGHRWWESHRQMLLHRLHRHYPRTVTLRRQRMRTTRTTTGTPVSVESSTWRMVWYTGYRCRCHPAGAHHHRCWGLPLPPLPSGHRRHCWRHCSHAAAAGNGGAVRRDADDGGDRWRPRLHHDGGTDDALLHRTVTRSRDLLHYLLSCLPHRQLHSRLLLHLLLGSRPGGDVRPATRRDYYYRRAEAERHWSYLSCFWDYSYSYSYYC